MLIPLRRCQLRSQECHIGALANSERIARIERIAGLDRTLSTNGRTRVAKKQRRKCGLFTTEKAARGDPARTRENTASKDSRR